MQKIIPTFVHFSKMGASIDKKVISQNFSGGYLLRKCRVAIITHVYKRLKGDTLDIPAHSLASIGGLR